MKTCLKNERRPPLPLIGGPSSLASRSRIVLILSMTVLLKAILAIAQRTLNCVFPKNPTYLGKFVYPATYPMIFPTPNTRLAIAFAASVDYQPCYGKFRKELPCWWLGAQSKMKALIPACTSRYQQMKLESRG